VEEASVAACVMAPRSNRNVPFTVLPIHNKDLRFTNDLQEKSTYVISLLKSLCYVLWFAATSVLDVKDIN